MSKLKLKSSNLPSYTMTLPVSGIAAKFRPFVVREEKVLLVAMQSKSQEQISDAINNIVSACTNGTVNTHKICSADAEYAFLQIRSKSIGEEAKPHVVCSKCKTETSLKIKLDQITLKAEKPKIDPTIKINDDVSFVMRYATIHDINTEKSPVDAAFDLVKQCVESVIVGDEVVPASDFEKQELSDYIDNMTPKEFEKIMDFFETTPKLNYGLNYDCPNCKQKVYVQFDSIADFFQ